MLLVEYIYFSLKNYPHPQIINKVTGSVYKLVNSESINVIQQGLKCLLCLVKLNPLFADPFKALLIESLDKPDPMISSVTIQIMINMITKKNAISLLNFIFKSQTKSASYINKQSFAPVFIKIIEKINELSANSPDMNQYF